MQKEKPTIGNIAIIGKELAIFGSRSGFAGPVIKDYEPFDDEATAIEDAKATIAELGLPLDPEISRPRITSMRATYSKSRRKKSKSVAIGGGVSR